MRRGARGHATATTMPDTTGASVPSTMVDRGSTTVCGDPSWHARHRSHRGWTCGLYRRTGYFVKCTDRSRCFLGSLLFLVGCHGWWVRTKGMFLVRAPLRGKHTPIAISGRWFMMFSSSEQVNRDGRIGMATIHVPSSTNSGH